MTKEKIRDYNLGITQATRTGLVVITYNIIIDYLDEAMEAFAKEDYTAYREALKKSRLFLNQLSGALDMQYQVSGNLMSLYIFMNKAFVRADFGNNTEELPRIKGMLEKLRDAFVVAGKSDTSGPVMENTQQVYAGLTYSKGSLNEDMYSAHNRGFTV